MGAQNEVPRLNLPMTWSVGPLAKSLMSLVVALMLLLPVLCSIALLNPGSVDRGVETVVLALASGFSLVLAPVIVFVGLRPRLVATIDGVTLHNPLRKKSIAWGDIVAIVPTAWGLKFETLSGPTLTSYSGLETPATWWLQNKRASDLRYINIAGYVRSGTQVAAQLMREVEARRASSEP